MKETSVWKTFFFPPLLPTTAVQISCPNEQEGKEGLEADDGPENMRVRSQYVCDMEKEEGFT